jgi:hypothetical protein
MPFRILCPLFLIILLSIAGALHTLIFVIFETLRLWRSLSGALLTSRQITHLRHIRGRPFLDSRCHGRVRSVVE